MRTKEMLRQIRALALFAATLAIAAGGAAADQVIPDDLIVQGSECVGFNCVNNEAFGFATIRLKEDNTRIDFVDTSGASFPTRDWRLQANPSTGATGRFSIIDMGNDGSSGTDNIGTEMFALTAGAPANSLFMSNTGNIGFGTAAPVLDLSMLTSDTPAVRFEQSGAGGFTPQTWDIGANEANFFIRDVTGGSRLSFRIRPGAPSSSLDIAANGNVGIGTGSPAVKLHVSPGRLRLERSATARYDMLTDGDGGLQFLSTGNIERMIITDDGNVGIGTLAPAVRLHTTGNVRFAGLPDCDGGLVTNALGTLACATSSRRFKNVAGALEPDVALANIMALKPMVGTYKETPDEPEHWLIAEDTAEVDAAFVGLHDGEPYTVKTQNIVADLIAVVQQQQARIEALEAQLAAR